MRKPTYHQINPLIRLKETELLSEQQFQQLLEAETVARFSVGILLLIVLHALNIFLSLLGAYVHGARLQYVEFFGKFYTGGGRAFNPLKTKEKYVNVEKK